MKRIPLIISSSCGGEKVIKRAEIKDYKDVTKLALLLWPDNEVIELQKEFKHILSSEEALILLGYDKDEVIAFAQCQLRHDYVEGTDNSPVGYLEGIYVKEAYRSKGLAKELLGECEKWAKDKGCSEFASDCELDNMDSLKFHLRAGFEEANRIICFTKRI